MTDDTELTLTPAEAVAVFRKRINCLDALLKNSERRAFRRALSPRDWLNAVEDWKTERVAVAMAIEALSPAPRAQSRFVSDEIFPFGDMRASAIPNLDTTRLSAGSPSIWQASGGIPHKSAVADTREEAIQALWRKINGTARR